MSKSDIDETLDFRPKFNADGLMACAATDAETGRLLMIAWVNAEALRATLETGEAHYWSRSRGELWRKGATSGNVQKIREVRIDCDQDALQYLIDVSGPACHTGRDSCFYRIIVSNDGAIRLSAKE
jgi:phosphoribosyl-AMP cyclohydrolase